MKRISLFLVLPLLLWGCFHQDKPAQISYDGEELLEISYIKHGTTTHFILNGYGDILLSKSSVGDSLVEKLELKILAKSADGKEQVIPVGREYLGEIALVNNHGSIGHIYRNEELPLEAEMEVWELKNEEDTALVLDLRLQNNSGEPVWWGTSWELETRDSSWLGKSKDYITPLEQVRILYQGDTLQDGGISHQWRFLDSVEPMDSRKFTFLLDHSTPGTHEEARINRVNSAREEMKRLSDAVRFSTVPLDFLGLVNASPFPPVLERDKLMEDPSVLDLLILLEDASASMIPAWIDLQWRQVKESINQVADSYLESENRGFNPTIALYHAMFLRASELAIRMNEPQGSMVYFDRAGELEANFPDEVPILDLNGASPLFNHMPYLLSYTEREDVSQLLDSITHQLTESVVNPLDPGSGDDYFNHTMWEFYSIHSGFSYNGLTREMKFGPLEDVLPMRFVWHTPDGYGTINASRAGFFLECLDGRISVDRISMQGRAFFVMREFTPSHDLETSYEQEVLTLRFKEPLKLLKGERFCFELP